MKREILKDYRTFAPDDSRNWLLFPEIKSLETLDVDKPHTVIAIYTLLDVSQTVDVDDRLNKNNLKNMNATFQMVSSDDCVLSNPIPINWRLDQLLLTPHDDDRDRYLRKLVLHQLPDVIGYFFAKQEEYFNRMHPVRRVISLDNLLGITNNYLTNSTNFHPFP